MPETRSRSKANMNGHHENGHKPHLNGSAQPKEVTYKAGFLKNLINQTLVPLFLMIMSPNLCILLWYTAARCDGSFMTLGEHLSSKGLVSIWFDELNICRPAVVYTILGYMIFAIILQMTLPGPWTNGPVSPKGNVPVYTDNGFSCYLVTMFSFVVLTHCLKLYSLTPTFVYDHFGDFLGSLTVFSHVLCAFLTIKGLVAPSSNDSGSSGNPIFDYYWGTELYPRVLGVDIKVFTNCRFGMTVWPLLCLIFAIKSYELYGFVDSMWVSCFLQMAYFTKFFWWESGYMRTIDIMVDRAGFYICWGCLCFIPGLYASVSLYLVNHPVHLGSFWSLVILTCGSLAILINYLADWQKQEVRDTDGQCLIWGKQPEVIRAKYTVESDSKPRESLLLVSGYWGIARHFHYVPELALAFSWTVPGLFENVMLYVYFIFLFILLTHRTFRDDIKCGLKYQKYWTEYCKRVPFKMIPGIF